MSQKTKTSALRNRHTETKDRFEHEDKLDKIRDNVAKLLAGLKEVKKTIKRQRNKSIYKYEGGL
jgi:hypothetical protein